MTSIHRLVAPCRRGYQSQGEHLLILWRSFLILLSTEEQVAILLGPYSVSKGNQLFTEVIHCDV